MTEGFAHYYDSKVKRISQSLFALLVSGGYLLSAKLTYAAGICPPGQFAGLCNIKPDKAGGMIQGVLSILLILAVVVALFFLVWGGVRWTMSGGDQAKIQAARSSIIAAIVGLVIAFLAFFIVSFVLAFFTGQGLGNFNIPTLV